MRKIILSSQSKNRKELLRALNIPFRVIVSDFDEQPPLLTTYPQNSSSPCLKKQDAHPVQPEGYSRDFLFRQKLQL